MRKIIHGGNIYDETILHRDIIDFSANINPLLMPYGVKKAIEQNIDSYMYYPDPDCRSLRYELSNYYKIDSNYFVCGNGAADIIFRIVLSLKPKKALLLAPTFSEYEEALNIVDCNSTYYNLLEDSNFFIKQDILNMINKDIDIVFLCNPNNPTGIPLERKKVIKIAQKCKQNNVILVIDECFSDFLEEEEKYTVIKDIEEYNNIIILKAFTKMYAMAGIRLGYMICSNRDLTFKVSNMLQPWSVSKVAEVAGIAALKEKDFKKNTVRYIKENRIYLISELRKLCYEVYDSYVNYILFYSKDTSLHKKLKDKGILIRNCSNYKGLKDGYYRIAVKDKKSNEIFINILNSLNQSKNKKDINIWQKL